MDKVYLPFWIVLEYLDQTPPEAFIPCFVLQSVAIDGITYHELALYRPDSDLKAYNVPAEYTIQPEHLSEWGHKIASWFIESAYKEVSKTDAVSDLANSVSCSPLLEEDDDGCYQEKTEE